MTRPILYSFRRCPYAMRARMALKASGVEVELREVLLKDKPVEMLQASPKGTAPVLVLQDGTVLDESLSIMQWALAISDPHHWRDGEADETNALIEENDGSFKHHLDRYKYATRYEDADPQADRSAGAAFLIRLNERLSRASAPCAALFGERDTLADIAIFPFVRQFRIADPEWFDAQDWPALIAWLTRLTDSALFQSVMEKYAPWRAGEDGVLF